MSSAGHSLSDSDYDSIAAAVMETARGRWFLAEYARRNRHADTTMLLRALRRLEAVVAGQGALPAEGVRAALAEMARMVERTRAQMAAARRLPNATCRQGSGYEFVSIVEDQEQATAAVLAAAEHVQDIAWMLREADVDASHCDALEARASEIYSACARHELVAQGTRRMAAALRFLDGRIGTLLAMTGGTSEHGRSPTAAEEVGSPPSQTQRFETSSTQTTTPADPFTRLAAAVVAAAERPARPSRDPLGALKALTPEETLALFS